MFLVAAAVTIGWLTACIWGVASAIALFTLAGMACLLAGVLAPAAGLMGVGILCCIDSISRVYLMSGGVLRWNTFNYVLLVLLFVRLPLALRERSGQAFMITCLVLLQSIELFHSQNRESGVQIVLGVASFLGILTVVRAARHRVRLFLWLAYLVAVISAVGSGVLLALGAGASEMNKNSYAYFPLCGVLAICGVLPLAGSKGPWLKVFVPLVLVNVMWVFATGSRGTTVLAFCGVVWMLASLPSASLRMGAIGAAGAATLLLAVVASSQIEYSLERIEKSMDSSRSLANRTSGRSDLAIAGWNLFLSNPLGVGTGSFSVEYARISRQIGVTSFEGKNLAAHSGWIRVLAENGFIGFGLLAGFVATFFMQSQRLENRSFRWSGMMTSVILGLAFLTTEFQSKPLWLLAALTLVVRGFAQLIGSHSVGRGMASQVLRSGRIQEALIPAGTNAEGREK